MDKDIVVTHEEVVKIQGELNGQFSMLIKIWSVGEVWNYVDRVRGNMINGILSLCPMYPSFKDHKGWTWEAGTAPPPQDPYVLGILV